MNLRKYASNKVIAIVTAIMLVISGFITQHYKIKKLQDELYIQQNMTEQRYNYTATSADIKTLEEELNSLCEYKILDGMVNIKHTYAYQKDSILGLKKKYKLVGTADFYYELVVNFKDVKIISFTDDEIVLEIDYPVVNEDACHRVPNTFIRLDDECDESLLSNKEDAETATRYWEDTFDCKGTKFISEYYTYEDVKKDITKVTILEIKTLLEELGYSQNLEVIVR